MTRESTAPRASPGASRRVVSPQLIGRDVELELLLDAVAHPPAVAVIEGEAGIGKSRLVGELVVRLESAEASGKSSTSCPPNPHVLVGRCHRVREPFPLGPVLEALRGLADAVGQLKLSPLAGALRPLLPELSDALPPALEPLGDAAAERHRTFRALVEVLDAAGPVVVAIDDAQWADDQTDEFLQVLTADSPEQLALVVTFRGEEVPASLVAALSRPPSSTTALRLSLAALDVESTGALTTAILGTAEVSAGVSAEFVSYLHDRTDGVPFAVEEVLALLRDRRELVEHRGQWMRGRLDALVVPKAVADAVLERVERLPPQARAAVEAAAVLQAPMPENVVAAVSAMDTVGMGTVGMDAVGADAVEVRAGLSQAITAGLLEGGDGVVGFRHVLAAEAVYQAIPDPRRRALHATAADALATLEPRPLGQLAHHLQHAGRTREWAEAAEAAADQATALGHDVEAVRLLEDVLRNAELRAELRDEQRGVLAVKLARAGAETVLDARQWLDLLAGALDGELSPVVRGELRLRLAFAVERSGGGDDEKRRLLMAALDDLDPLCQDAQRPDLLAWALTSLGLGSARDKHWLDRALRLLPQVDDRAFEVFLCGKIAMMYTSQGDPAWRALRDRVVERTEGAPRSRREVNAFYSVGMSACYVGHYDAADGLLTAARVAAPATGSAQLALRISSALALLDYGRGVWQGLRDRVDAIAADVADYPASRIDSDVVAACLDVATGEVGDGGRKLSELARELEDWGQLDLLAWVLDARARLAVRSRGGSAEMASTLRGLFAAIDSTGDWMPAARVLPWSVATFIAADEPAEARAVVQRAADGLEGLDAPLADAAVEFALGFLADAEEEVAGATDRAADRATDTAAQHFRRAADLYADLQCPYEAAQAREQAGLALARTEDRRAEEVLRSALEAYERLGATWDHARCARVARSHGVTLPVPYRRGPKGYGTALSPRERQVAELAAEGRSNQEIADELFLSVFTIKKQLSSAMRKLNVESRAALARAFLTNGSHEGTQDQHIGGHSDP